MCADPATPLPYDGFSLQAAAQPFSYCSIMSHWSRREFIEIHQPSQQFGDILKGQRQEQSLLQDLFCYDMKNLMTHLKTLRSGLRDEAFAAHRGTLFYFFILSYLNNIVCVWGVSHHGLGWVHVYTLHVSPFPTELYQLYNTPYLFTAYLLKPDLKYHYVYSVSYMKIRILVLVCILKKILQQPHTKERIKINPGVFSLIELRLFFNSVEKNQTNTPKYIPLASELHTVRLLIKTCLSPICEYCLGGNETLL